MIEVLLQAERDLSVGQLDAAQRLYQQVITTDPRNSIAVVGLARVALERGKDREAYQLARAALQIDPDNAAAQRLVARLAEVMRHRGEEPPTEAPPRLGGAETPGGVPEPALTAAPEPALTAAPESSRKPGLVRRLLGRPV